MENVECRRTDKSAVDEFTAPTVENVKAQTRLMYEALGGKAAVEQESSEIDAATTLEEAVSALLLAAADCTDELATLGDLLQDAQKEIEELRARL